MKYTTKTAIEIMTEDDRLEVIPFLESLGGVNVLHVSNDNIDIGEIWYISTDKNKIVINKYVDLQYNNYTILKGVPKDWREESEIPTFEDWFENLTRTESDELEKKYGYYGHDISTTEDEWLGIYNDEFGIKQNKDNSISISKLTETNSRLDQLESENNEMRDSLKSILDMYETDNRDANDWYDLMYKAKQLLEK